MPFAKWVLALSLVILTCLSVRADEEDQSAEANKDLILDFYQMGIIHGDVKGAFSIYVSPLYQSHTEQGKRDFIFGQQAVVDRVLSMQGRQIVVERIIGDGDTVVVHARAVSKSGPSDTELIDLFRLVGQKITDHWAFERTVPRQPAR